MSMPSRDERVRAMAEAIFANLQKQGEPYGLPVCYQSMCYREDTHTMRADLDVVTMDGDFDLIQVAAAIHDALFPKFTVQKRRKP